MTNRILESGSVVGKVLLLGMNCADFCLQVVKLLVLFVKMG